MTLAPRSRIIEEASAEVCASAPQFLQPGSPDCTHAAASYLAWPLFMVARVDKKNCSDFVRHALLFIGEELRIKSARMAALGLDAEDYNDEGLMTCYVF